MDSFKSFFRQYWANTLAVTVFAVAVLRYSYLAQWLPNLPLAIAAAIGLLMFVASEEFSEIMGNSSYFRFSDLSHHFPQLIRFGGIVILLLVTYALFGR